MGADLFRPRRLDKESAREGDLKTDMPFLAERFIHVVLLLAAIIFLVSLLLIAVAIGRRFRREREFKILDAFRERSRSILEVLSAGALDYEAALEQIRKMIEPRYAQDIERILLEQLDQPRYRAAIGRLIEDLGMIRSWQRRVGDTTKPPPGSRGAAPSLRREARFYHRARDAQNLGRVGHRESWRLLVKALDDAHEDVREAAVRSLAVIGEPESFPALVEQLRASLTSPKPLLSDRVLRPALARFPLALADHLQPLLEHSNSQVRLAAAHVLRDMLANESAAVRSGSVKLKPDLSRLIPNRLAGDNDPDVRAVAADLMSFLQDEASGDKLIRSAGDAEWFVRLHAVRAIGERRNQKFHAVLAARLTDQHWRVREAAARALAGSGPEEARELLRAFVAAGDEYARDQIAEALDTSGLMAELAKRCAGGDAPQEREVLFEVVKMGKTSCLESWLKRQTERERRAFLTALGECSDPHVRRWVEQMAE